MMEVPESVLIRADGLIKLYGNNITYIGKCNDKYLFKFVFPENTITGFPYLYLYDSKTDITEVITGRVALDVMTELSN